MNMNTHIILPFCLLLTCAPLGCREHEESRFVAADNPYATVYTVNPKTKAIESSDFLPRGVQIQVVPDKTVNRGDSVLVKIKSHKKGTHYIFSENITTDPSLIVTEKILYARSPVSIISDTLTSKIAGLAAKGSKLQIVGFDMVDHKGEVNRYKVKSGTRTGYVYAKYLVRSKESAMATYMPEVYDAIHLKARNRFGGGKAIDCDFYPYQKPQFEDNRMPESCYSIYINFAPGNLAKIDEYIALAKKTKINTFVIDIKDNECPGYKADAMKKYSPTNYSRASAKGEDLYRYAVDRLHEEGFYVVGRITCFKDSYYVKDNPKSAITEVATGQPYKHNKSYWPSAFDRNVWQFNVELAKESVEKFGFDEINFDYVRFPDRLSKVENLIDYHNRYGESKVQAIQRFVMYACDEIHAKGAYVSIDVFGETVNPDYTTPYGQYWPAISNVADVICGMPYPDHFADMSYGISKPWNHPYELMKAWGRFALKRQEATPCPAKVRTWIQAYPVMKYVDQNGISYDAAGVEQEIRGLFSAGLKDGYIPWLSTSNLSRYTMQAPAYRIDYLKEYR